MTGAVLLNPSGTQTILGADNYLGINGYLTGNTGSFTSLVFSGPGAAVPNKIFLGSTGTHISGIGTSASVLTTAYYCVNQHTMYVQSGVATSGILALNVINGSTYTGAATSSVNVTGDFFVDGSSGGTSAWYSTSDYRIKKDVQPLNDTYTVDKLIPVSYYNTLSNTNDVGLIAHELQDIYPFMVNGIKDGPKSQSVQYTALIGILIKEIQRLKERVDKLENK
jgi:hypothetical protein